MIPLLAPSGGMAKDEAADFLRGGLTAELLRLAAVGGGVKTTGMDVYTTIPNQPPARDDQSRSASGQLVGQHVTVSRHHRVADLDRGVLAVVGDADQDKDWYSGWELQRPSLFR
jgi:hypothetical protein